MKRTAKVLSLAMVAFMLSGCNLFNKSSDGEVKWQEFDFDESQRLDEAKAADLLNHAKLALEEFSDVSIVEKEMLSLNNYESEGETTIKIKAYSNSLVVEEKKTSEKVKEDGITLSAKTEKKTQSLDVRYMDGLDEKTVTLKYADASDSGVTMSRSYLDSSVYEQTLTAQSISVPTGLAIYQVKKQYFAVESTVTEYVDYIPYESGVKEQLMEMKAQTVYTFDSEKRLVSCTNYNEAIANRDDMDGSWYKKAKTVLKYTKSKSISYKARSEGNASHPGR